MRGEAYQIESGIYLIHLLSRFRENMDSDLNLADEVDFIKKDVDFAVDFIDASEKLPEKDGRIYINIQTKEKNRFCVELSSSGFKVCLFVAFYLLITCEILRSGFLGLLRRPW